MWSTSTAIILANDWLNPMKSLSGSVSEPPLAIFQLRPFWKKCDRGLLSMIYQTLSSTPMFLGVAALASISSV